MNFNQFKNSNAVLNEEQMKSVKGGTGTCGYNDGYGINCNVSREEALFMVQDGGYWCCESCATTSYCGDAQLQHEP